MPKIYMDDYSGTHVSERIEQHFSNPDDQQKMVNAIRKLLTLPAPSAAIGQYKWYINVGRIGRIILRGYTIRTVYPFTHNFPGGTEYRISKGKLARA